MGSRTRTQRAECMDMNRRKYYVARERVISERRRRGRREKSGLVRERQR